ncbi:MULTISPECIES: hypothetical protein [unclassified Robiginitalea]|uniref:baeRF7 domain-containing protein n=1 Tax=Robiginitalea TaxID=252306 RepID=UPI00234B0BA9|nr:MULTISPECIES: hypothetical protein [unclassified Robiginitalea]MDC6355625.1 hypothetical protein [Robiginitalea sp. PM2]MDC6376036.1 hypothetical protein [Robiginitalea sp. SP8]
MTLLTKKAFTQLIGVHAPTCISIFIPTHRAGQEVLEKKDQLALKNQLKEVSHNLAGQGYSDQEVKSMLEPAAQLLEDTEFWRHQSDGLALFISEGFFQKFTLPLEFEAAHHIGNSFHLVPLMPLLTGDGRFFILALGLEGVKFYEGTKYSIARIIVYDLTPARLEDRVGYDYEEKFLQFRSQQEGAGHAMFHGHGEGEADHKNEILRYFRAVDEGLMQILHDERQPLVLASLDYLAPIYREANNYNHLFESHISGNPGDDDLMSLHGKAWELVAPHFESGRREKAGAYQQALGTGKASPDLRDILPAAMDGRIDALFLREGEDVQGLYNQEDRELEIHESLRETSVSLFNLAAVETYLQGGDVFVVPDKEMPDDHSAVCALYRY